MARVYARKFDWDEAARLREQGLSYDAIAARLEVSQSAVYLSLNDVARERVEKANRVWQRKHGWPHTYNKCACGQKKHKAASRCQSCVRADTIRSDTLFCGTCEQWKADEDFSPAPGRPGRRGRHSDCRSCDTARRREWRKNNIERERETWRRARRKKAAA